MAAAGKVFIVAEFGWGKGNLTIEQLQAALREVETTPNISGDLFWAGRADAKTTGTSWPFPGWR